MLVVIASAAADTGEQRVQRVIDGDTFVLTTGERVRLWGIDAPETGEAFADEATVALQTEVADGVRCRGVNIDRYNRIVAVCSSRKHRDISSWLVSNGLAVDWPRYSDGHYFLEERWAKARKKGMWQ